MLIRITTRADAVTRRHHVLPDNSGTQIVPLRNVVGDFAIELPRILTSMNKKAKGRQLPLVVNVTMPNEYEAGSGKPLLHVQVTFEDDDKVSEADQLSLNELIGQAFASWFSRNGWIFPAADFCYEIGAHGKSNTGAKNYKQW